MAEDMKWETADQGYEGQRRSERDGMRNTIPKIPNQGAHRSHKQ